MYTLYSYYRSSAAYRVRIALHLKKLPHIIVPVHLLKEGGEHLKKTFLELNPQGLIPVLVDDDQIVLQQSMSILEYLDEKHPNPPLLPKAPQDRAFARTIANIVACDIHPLNNLRVLRYLKHDLKQSDETKLTWIQYWISKGFEAIESLLNHSKESRSYCLGQSVSLADVCLIPQVYNAIRFECPMSHYPNIQRIYEHCMGIEAFVKASPENQANFEITN